MLPITLAFSAVILCSGVVVSETDVADFDVTYRGYHLIFHDNHDLLLAVDDDSCFFVHMPDTKELVLVDGNFLISQLKETENHLLESILTNKSGDVHPSSLDTVRDRYGDILADFHCFDKHIFEIVFFHQSATTTARPPVHHSVCRPQDQGQLSPHPGTCAYYEECDNGQTVVMPCPPGTLFVPSLHRCDRPELAPDWCHQP